MLRDVWRRALVNELIYIDIDYKCGKDRQKQWGCSNLNPSTLDQLLGIGLKKILFILKASSPRQGDS